MIFKIVLFAVAISLILVVVKENFKSGAVVLSVAGCVSLFMIFTNIFASLKDTVTELTGIDTVDKQAISVIFKTLVVAYLTSFGCDICTDAGEKAIANALEMAGKAIMFSMAFPMILGIFNSVKDIMGG